MDYTTAQNSLMKTKINLVKIKADYCANTFGLNPCTSSGINCYNTFPTCKDQQNFTKLLKIYSFVSGDIPEYAARNYYPARPYIKSISDLPTEINESDTITKRLTITFLDETDNDIGIDPYQGTRNIVQGTFWKKWIARNKNYKGRIIEVYEGYIGLDIDNFKMKFVGRIENINYNNNEVELEATDILKKLSEIEYPLKTKYTVKTRIPNYFTASSQDEMLALNAYENDFCERTDFIKISSWALSTHALGGILKGGGYKIRVVAYDQFDRPIGLASNKFTLSNTYQTNYVSFAYGAVSNADKYKIFIQQLVEYVGGIPQDIENPIWIYKGETASLTYNIYNLTGDELAPPETAQAIYQLSTDDATDINNWALYTSAVGILTDLNSTLDNSGYIRLDKEIIKYESKIQLGGYDILYNVSRKQYNTEADEHKSGSSIFVLFDEDPANPFYLLDKILDTAQITSEYIDSKFDTYKNSWTGINFSTKPIVKDTKLNKIYFDLVNVLDCNSWQGEDGLIKILYIDERETELTEITDKSNIILGSGKVDLNEESRRTRWGLFYERHNVEGDIEDTENYSKGIIIIDADAENDAEYGEIIEDIKTTTWINDDCGTEAEITAYIESLLNKRKARTRNAQIIYECDLDNKDGNIETGNVIKLSTNDIQDETGASFSNMEFRVVKKTPKQEKFNLKLIKAE